MNILVLGGKQTCGPGLPTGRGYLAQFLRRHRADRRSVQVDYRPVTLAEATQLLPRLRLTVYDLIILQFDTPLSWLPKTASRRLLMRGTLGLYGQKMACFQDVRSQLSRVLLQVQLYRRQVVLMSPLPHAGRLEQQVGQLTRTVYVQQSRDWQVPLFDVMAHLPGGDELFQADSPDHLSAVAHEVLGSELHTFITEPTCTLWP